MKAFNWVIIGYSNSPLVISGSESKLMRKNPAFIKILSDRRNI